MTDPKSPIEALDEQERELARVLRALPGGEPSAALDQKILRAAANAAASSRRPRARWLASASSLWGIGGAAAAVLALGVTWQMLDPTRPASLRQGGPTPAASIEDSMVTVDLGEADAPPNDAGQTAAAAPPPEPATSPARPPMQLPARANVPEPAPRQELQPSAAPARAAAPAAFAEDRAATQVSGAGLGDKSESDAAPVLSLESAAADESALAEQWAAQENAERERELARTVGAAGAMAKATQPSQGAMTPAVWLTRIRQLRSERRLDEARNSLELFHRYYPQYVIPTDLAPLLRE